MPQIGEIRKGADIGYKDLKGRWVWVACSDCGKERWVHLRKGKPESCRCPKCQGIAQRGAGNPSWKGGYRYADGYREIKLQPDDFFYPMAKKSGYVAEHRLVMAKHLHRCLLPWEIVHHKNGIRDDNRLEKLELLPTMRQHLPDSTLKSRIKQLEQRVTLLEADNTLLRRQSSMLTGAFQGDKDHQ